MIEIRRATQNEAGACAALVRQHADTLIDDPDAAGEFWKSMSEAAHAQNLGSPRFVYFLALDDELIVGYIAIRDGTHLFNFFVQKARLQQGIGKALWLHFRANTPADEGAVITVNASVNAVPVYRALGFEAAAPVRQQHGVAFIPMQYAAARGAT